MDMPHPLPEQNRTNGFSKFSETSLAFLAAGTLLAMVLEVLPEKWQEAMGEKVFYWIYEGTLVLSVLFGIIYSIYWHRKEKKGTIRSGVRHAWFQAIIRYWLALEIATYGFAKILGTQFSHQYYRDDMPVTDLNGFNLTWNYFSYSYPMAVIIAMVQIVGSALLLFRRTTLLGVTILLPVMLNILLINIFYDIAAGAFANSVFFSLGLIYLLTRHWAPLKKVYLNAISSLPAIRMGIWKMVLKVVCVAAAFAFIYSYTLQDVKSPLEGKWKVISMRKNGVPVEDNAWRNDTTAWANMYFESYGRAVFSSNPYVFEKKSATWFNYKLDTLKKTMTLNWRVSATARDTTQVKLLKYSLEEVDWEGRIGKDSFLVRMQPVKRRIVK